MKFNVITSSISILCVLLVATLSSCSIPSRRHLSQIEHLLEQDPEGASLQLDSLDTSHLNKRNLALYAMLKTQADYKLYRDIPTDSVIRIATDFYGTKRKDYHAAMAWYSLGCISGEHSQDRTAANAYLNAMHMFPDTLVRYYALCEQNLSYIYLEHEMHEEAIGLIHACRTNAVRLSDSAAIAFCDLNIAKYLLYRNEYQDAENMFLQLKDNRWLSVATRNNTLMQLAKIALVHSHDYVQTLQYANAFLAKRNTFSAQSVAFTNKADAFLNLNNLDSALYYYHQALAWTNDPFTACISCRGLAKAHAILANQDSIEYYTEQANRLMDAIVVSSGSGKIRKALLSNVTDNNTENKKSHPLLYIAILCSLVFSTGTILYREKTNKDYLLKDSSNTNDKKEKSHIRDFSNDIEEFKGTELYQIMANLALNDTEIENDYRNEFEKNFHNSLVGLRKYVVANSSQLTMRELDYCMTTLMGFKQRDFHLFFNVSYSGSRNYKFKIKGKMSEQLFNEIFGPRS